MQIRLNSYTFPGCAIEKFDDESVAKPQIVQVKPTRRDGTRVTSVTKDGKTIRVAGTIMSENLESAIDALKAAVDVQGGYLDRPYGDGYRRYVVTLADCIITRQYYHLSYAPFELTFLAESPFGVEIDALGGDPVSQSALTLTDVTDDVTKATATFGGSGTPESDAVVTFTKIGDMTSFEIVNETTGEQLTVTAPAGDVDGDVYTIDSETHTVTRNGDQSDYSGVVPEFVPGANDLAVNVYSSSGTTVEAYQNDTNGQQLFYGAKKVAQSFTFSVSAVCPRVSLLLSKVGNPTGDITVSIQTDAAGAPSGTPVTDGEFTIPASEVKAWAVWLTKATSWPSISTGTTYHMVLSTTGGDTTNYYRWHSNSAGAYAGGSAKVNPAAAWTAITGDMCFKAFKVVLDMSNAVQDHGTYTEDFSTTTKKDAANTTAVWDTSSHTVSPKGVIKQNTASVTRYIYDVRAVGSYVYYLVRMTDGTRFQIYLGRSNLDGTGFTLQQVSNETTGSGLAYISFSVLGSKIYYAAGRIGGDGAFITGNSNLDGTGWVKTEQRTTNGISSTQCVAVGTKVYYAWIGNDASYWKNVFYASSNLDGSGFTSSQQTSLVSSNVQLTLSMCVDDTKMYYAWTDSVSGVYQVFRGVSNLDGTGFTSAQQTYNATNTNCYKLILKGTKLYYCTLVKYGTVAQVETATSDLDGSNYVSVKQTNGARSAEYPTMSLSDNNINLIWYMSDGSYRQIFTGRCALDGSGFTSVQQTSSAYSHQETGVGSLGDATYFMWSEVEGTNYNLYTLTDGYYQAQTLTLDATDCEILSASQVTNTIILGTSAYQGQFSTDGGTTWDDLPRDGSAFETETIPTIHGSDLRFRWLIRNFTPANTPYITDTALYYRKGFALDATTKRIDQAFTAPTTGGRSRFNLWLAKVGTPGTCTFEVCADSGGNPGTVIQTATFTAADVSTLFGKVTINLPAPAALTSGTTYHIRLSAAGVDASNKYLFLANTSKFASGVLRKSDNSGGAYTAVTTGEDLVFQSYATTGSPFKYSLSIPYKKRYV